MEINDANYKSHVIELEQFFIKKSTIYLVWPLNIVQIHGINQVSAKLLRKNRLTANISIFILMRNRHLNTALKKKFSKLKKVLVS